MAKPWTPSARKSGHSYAKMSVAQAEPLRLLQLSMGYGLCAITADLGDGGARAKEVLLEAVQVKASSCVCSEDRSRAAAQAALVIKY